MAPAPLPPEDYRLLFENNPQPMWVFDRTTFAFLAVNEAAVRHYGYSREEFLSMTLRDIRPAEEVPLFDAYLSRVAQGMIPADTTWVGIWRHRKKDATVIEVEIWRTPIDFQGRSASLAMIVDVTDRRRAEAALRESEARFRSAFTNADIGMTLTGLDGRFLQVNRALCRMLRYSESELVGRRFRDVTHPEDVEGNVDAMRRMLAGETESMQFEKRYLRSDGKTVWVYLTASLIRNAEGTPLYFVAQIQDITLRKKTEEKLRSAHEESERRVEERTSQLAAANVSLRQQIVERERAEERLRQIAEHIPAIFWMSDPRITQMIYVSPAYERIWGRSCEEVMARPDSFLDAVHPEDRARALAGLEGQLRGEYEHEEEYRIVRPDGSVRWVWNRAFPIRNEYGEVYRMAGFATDVTERKRAEEEIRDAAESTRRAYDALKSTQNKLIQAEKLASVGMVMAGVAHEINNPLNVIYGNLRLLKDCCTRFRETKGPGPEELRKVARMLEDALRAAENARIVVEEFRHFARDAGAAEVSDLRECVQEAVEQVRPQCDGRIRIVQKLAKLPQMSLLRGPIRRAVANLIRNAADAIEKSGTITVLLARRNRHAVLEVADTGRGIAPEHLGRIFEPFFTTKQAGRGFGLGLSLCQAVVQAHGGRISVRSRPGKGTRFSVQLPIAKKTRRRGDAGTRRK